MAGAVRVDIGATGRAIAVKRARGDAATARLRHEAEVLGLVAGPGVVELVSLDELGDGTVELATRYAGPVTLAAATLGTSLEVATVVARVAHAVAAAHVAGVSHGAVSAEHLVLAADGAPVLCGWGSAVGPVAGVPPGAAEDVRALGTLLLDLVPEGGDDTGRRLRALATNAAAADAARRPPMVALAAALDAVTDPATPPPPPFPRTRRAARVTSVAATVLVVTAVVLTAGAATPSHDRRAPRAPLPSRPSVPTTRPTTVPTPPTTVRPTAERVWPAQAPVVEHDGVRWVAGVAGDRAFEVEWGCAGPARLAVVRPSTGAVYVFDEWPAPGATPAGRLVARVAGATAVHARDSDGDGCGELEVLRDGGEPVPVGPGA